MLPNPGEEQCCLWSRRLQVSELLCTFSVSPQCYDRAYDRVILEPRKEKSAKCLDDLLCFAKWAGWKVTPSAWYDIHWISSLAKSAEREGLVKVRSITVLRVKCLRFKLSLPPKFRRYEITVTTSQKDEYLGWGGLV